MKLAKILNNQKQRKIKCLNLKCLKLVSCGNNIKLKIRVIYLKISKFYGSKRLI